MISQDKVNIQDIIFEIKDYVGCDLDDNYEGIIYVSDLIAVVIAAT